MEYTSPSSIDLTMGHRRTQRAFTSIFTMGDSDDLTSMFTNGD